MGCLHKVVIGDDETVVQLVIDGAIGGYSQDFHHNGIITTELRLDIVEFNGYLIERIRFMLVDVVKHNSNMIIAT